MRLHAAADAYRTALAVAAEAATRSRLTRQDADATWREVARTNQASLDAHKAFEHARDQLVAAALAHHCDEAA